MGKETEIPFACVVDGGGNGYTARNRFAAQGGCLLRDGGFRLLSSQIALDVWRSLSTRGGVETTLDFLARVTIAPGSLTGRRHDLA